MSMETVGGMRGGAGPHLHVQTGDEPRPELTSADVDVVLARVRSGQRKEGVEFGPDRLVEFGLFDHLASIGRRVRRVAQVDERQPGSLEGTALEDLSAHVSFAARMNRFALTLGGDHSVAFSTIDGLLRTYPDLRILYVDAHADLNTPESSPSGNPHGMPIAAHLGLFQGAQIPAVTFVNRTLRPEQIAFVGIRDLDPEERTAIDGMNIACFTSQDIHKDGMPAVIERALNRIDPEGRYPLHVSFDIDVADPSIAPATGVPVPGGLHRHHLLMLANAICKTRRLVGLDIVEINPLLAEDDAALQKTLSVATDFALDILRVETGASADQTDRVHAPN